MREFVLRFLENSGHRRRVPPDDQHHCYLCLGFSRSKRTRLAKPSHAGYGTAMSKDKKPSRQQVFTLLVEIGRKAGDGLPKNATGAALVIYASGVDEAEAVRETVAILKQADTAPLDVSGYGTLDERLAEGHDISDEERALMQRAMEENAVIVAQLTPFFD